MLSLTRLVGPEHDPVHIRIARPDGGYDEALLRVISRTLKCVEVAIECDPQVFNVAGVQLPKSTVEAFIYLTHDRSGAITHRPTGLSVIVSLYEPTARSRRSKSCKLTFDEPGNTKHFRIVRGEIKVK